MCGLVGGDRGAASPRLSQNRTEHLFHCPEGSWLVSPNSQVTCSVTSGLPSQIQWRTQPSSWKAAVTASPEGRCHSHHHPRGSSARWNEGRVLTNHRESVLEEDTAAQTQEPRERRAFPSVEWLQTQSPIPMNTAQDHQQGEHTFHLQVRLGQPHHAQGSPVDRNVSISFFRDPWRHLPTYSACLSANHSLLSTKCLQQNGEKLGSRDVPNPHPTNGLEGLTAKAALPSVSAELRSALHGYIFWIKMTFLYKHFFYNFAMWQSSQTPLSLSSSLESQTM